MISSAFSCFITMFSFITDILTGNVSGKVELAPAYVHLDVIESNKTIKKMDMLAFRADGCVIFGRGWSLKPTFTYASQNGKLLIAGLGVGRCIPLLQKFVLSPSAGFIYTKMKTDIDLPQFMLTNVKEEFESYSGYLGGDLTFLFTPSFRVSLQYLYAWSKSRAELEDLGNSKSYCSGPTYGLLAEYDLNKWISLNTGIGYNLSLSKEKHGIRGYGVKAGISLWF